MLRDVEHATVALLDRWQVTITRTPAGGGGGANPGAGGNAGEASKGVGSGMSAAATQLQQRVTGLVAGGLKAEAEPQVRLCCCPSACHILQILPPWCSSADCLGLWGPATSALLEGFRG